MKAFALGLAASVLLAAAAAHAPRAWAVDNLSSEDAPDLVPRSKPRTTKAPSLSLRQCW